MSTMKKQLKRSGVYALTFVFLMSCNAIKNANNTQKGAVIGATSGAVIGGVIGNNVGNKKNSVLGAIIGGVVGGAAGAYIGNRMDRQAERIEEEVPGAEVTRVGEGINVTFDESSGVYFDTGKYSVNSKSQTTLKKLAGVFKEFPNSDILIEGHTDNVGSETSNMTLSKQRAKSVSNFLVNEGLSSKRFTTKWYGEDQPKYGNETSKNRAKNRRVELAIVANDKLKKEARKNTQ